MIKQTIKNILGEKNARKIGKSRQFIQISTNRFIRSIFNGKKSLPALETRIFSLPDAHLFFGYYDVPQFSYDENLLLASAAPLMNTTPAPDDRLRLGFFDLFEKKPEFKEFGSTNTWCWQQGCRLQWYPYDGKDTVIYNKLVNDQYGCVIQDILKGKTLRSFSRPIYALSRDGKWGLSLDFSRLQRLRPGYGYNTLPDFSVGKKEPTEDGIWRINMETGEERLLFSVNDISSFEQNEPIKENEHYFNHLLFNFNGDRFMFFHIMQMPTGKRNIRMLTSDINGENIRLINGSGHSSHYCWKNNDILLCYSTIDGKGTGYYLYEDGLGSVQIVGAHELTEDGHPSFIPGKEEIITDTYPDKYGESSLLLYQLSNESISVLAKEFLPTKFRNETRCDLHPRVAPSGEFISIDCILDSKRAIKVFKTISFIN